MAQKARPWTIKGLPEDARSVAIAASKADKLPIGLWLAKTIMEKTCATSSVNRETSEQQPMEVDEASASPDAGEDDLLSSVVEIQPTSDGQIRIKVRQSGAVQVILRKGLRRNEERL